MDDQSDSPSKNPHEDDTPREGEKFVRSFSKSSPIKPRLTFGTFESAKPEAGQEEAKTEPSQDSDNRAEDEDAPPAKVFMPSSVEELQRLMGENERTQTPKDAPGEFNPSASPYPPETSSFQDADEDESHEEDSSDDFDEPAADPIVHEASPSATLPYRRESSWSGYLTRWLIRLLFLAGLGVVYVLIYRKLSEPPPMPTKTQGVSQTINVPARFYQIRALGKDWTRIDDARLERADVVLARKSPACRLWVESRSHIGPPPVKAAMLLDLQESWQKQLTDMREVRQWEDLVSGQVAQFLEATGMVDDRSVRWLGGVFTYAGFVYHVVGEAEEAEFEAARPEIEYALKTVRLLPAPSVNTTLATHRFVGSAFEYSLEAPPTEWRESPELEADSRFADLKLVSKDRLRTIVVTPRPDASIESLQELASARLQKLYGDRLFLRPDVEELTIGGNPARRLQASLQGDGGNEILVLVFIQGAGIAYQIDARGPSDSAANWLPATYALLDTFQPGSSQPKQNSDPTDNKPRDDHFQRAPKEFNR